MSSFSTVSKPLYSKSLRCGLYRFRFLHPLFFKCMACRDVNCSPWLDGTPNELASCPPPSAQTISDVTALGDAVLLHSMLQYFHCGVRERLHPPHRLVNDTGLLAFFSPIDLGRKWTAGCPFAWYCWIPDTSTNGAISATRTTSWYMYRYTWKHGPWHCEAVCLWRGRQYWHITA